MPCSSSTRNERGNATTAENKSVTQSIPAAMLGAGLVAKLESDIATTASRLNRNDVNKPWRDRISVSHSLWKTANASDAQDEFVGCIFSVRGVVCGDDDCAPLKLIVDRFAYQSLPGFVKGGTRFVEEQNLGRMESCKCKL